MSDVNIEGHFAALVRILRSPDWREFSLGIGLEVRTFAEVGLAHDASDEEVWEACQREKVFLLTANRNAGGPTSLEAVLRTRNIATSLPVFTVADIAALGRSREYGERVVACLLEYLLEGEQILGAGRLYLP